MSATISLKETEARAFRAAHQDGLWEVLIGCFLLTFVIGPFLAPSLGDLWGTLVAFVPFWVVGAAAWLVKRHLVAPRIGVVKFGRARQAILVRMNLWVFLVLLAAFVAGLFSAAFIDVVPGWVHTMLFGLSLLATFGTAAYFLEFAPLYLYGALIALCAPVGEVLWVYLKVPHHGWPVTFGAAAAFLILTGLVKLARVLRENPLPAAGPSYPGSRDDRPTV